MTEVAQAAVCRKAGLGMRLDEDPFGNCHLDELTAGAAVAQDAPPDDPAAASRVALAGA